MYYGLDRFGFSSTHINKYWILESDSRFAGLFQMRTEIQIHIFKYRIQNQRFFNFYQTIKISELIWENINCILMKFYYDFFFLILLFEPLNDKWMSSDRHIISFFVFPLLIFFFKHSIFNILLLIGKVYANFFFFNLRSIQSINIH